MELHPVSDQYIELGNQIARLMMRGLAEDEIAHACTTTALLFAGHQNDLLGDWPSTWS